MMNKINNHPGQADETTVLTLAERLKSSTQSRHDDVNHAVMTFNPFGELERYKSFLQVQYLFHAVLRPFYKDEALNRLLPGLDELARFDSLTKDLDDLKTSRPVLEKYIYIANKNNAIGWLYCSEGSNIGAAILFKASQKLGLDANHGARHLAAAPEGRLRHWREFVAQLNALPFTLPQQNEVLEGAHQAFDFYNTLVKDFMLSRTENPPA